MNLSERKIFWDTLCSLRGTDIEGESEKLRQAIKLPRFLYRYRPVNLKTLEALRTNMLYFSSANYYDDPFDTFLYIDTNKIKNAILADIDNPQRMEEVKNIVKTILHFPEQLAKEKVDFFVKESSQEHLNDFLEYTLSLRGELKKNTWSVCFSENGLNEVLWLKYADQYRGVVLIYDLEKSENLLCGKQQKCLTCGISKFGTPLYPIYYSDTPYDATSFAQFVILCNMAESSGIPQSSQLYHSADRYTWEREKITLIKKECHKYDEEWRMILPCPMNPPIMREWIPSGIILGLRMEQAEANLVISIAKDAGIKQIFRTFINKNSQLSIDAI